MNLVLKFTLLVFCISLINKSYSQETIDLSGVIFDQSPARNPDFEINPYVGGVVNNMVLPTLGSDGTPQYCCGNNAVLNRGDFEIHNSSTFYSWFHPVNGVNIALPISLRLTEDSNGVYKFQSNAFFPIDGKGFDNKKEYPNEITYLGHNFHFCMKIHYSFTYRGGEYFKFTGDDDVWVYFNNKLAIDIGGVHQAASRTVYLDQLGLTRGQTYPWDFFYCERHTSQSTLNIETNLIFKCAYYDKCNVCQGKNNTCCFPGKCNSLQNPCQLYTCSAESNYNCKRTIGECNNGDLCTNFKCIRGVGCQFTNDKCDDHDACTLDSCNSINGQCSHTPVSCDDHDACTTDRCDSLTGRCVHTPISCDDGNECTNDQCFPLSGCIYTQKNCLDGLGCTVDSCDNSTGCIHTQLPNCTECHDAAIERCTTDDLCFPKVCNPFNTNECITQAINCSIFETDCIDVVCIQGECIFTYTCETPQPPSESPTTSKNNTQSPSHISTLTPTVSITQSPTPSPTGTPLPPPHTYRPDDPPPKKLLKSCLHCEDLNCKEQLSDSGQMASCTYIKNDLYDDDCDDCCLWIPTCYFDSAANIQYLESE